MKWKVIIKTFNAYGYQSDARIEPGESRESRHRTLPDARKSLEGLWFSSYLDWNESRTAGFFVDDDRFAIVHIDVVIE